MATGNVPNEAEHRNREDDAEREWEWARPRALVELNQTQLICGHSFRILHADLAAAETAMAPMFAWICARFVGHQTSVVILRVINAHCKWQMHFSRVQRGVEWSVKGFNGSCLINVQQQANAQVAWIYQWHKLQVWEEVARNLAGI